MTFSALLSPSSYTVSHQVQLILLTQYFWNPPALYCYLFLLDLQNFFSDFIEVTIFKQKSNMTFPYFGCAVLLHEFGTKLSEIDTAALYICGLSGIISVRRFLSVVTVSVCLSNLQLHGASDGLMVPGVALWNTGAHSHWGHASHRLHWEVTENRRASEADTVLGYTASLWKCFLVWKHPIGFVEHPQIHYSFKLFHSFVFFFTKARPALWSAQLPLPSLILFHFSCNELLTYWILSWYFAS